MQAQLLGGYSSLLQLKWLAKVVLERLWNSFLGWPLRSLWGEGEEFVGICLIMSIQELLGIHKVSLDSLLSYDSIFTLSVQQRRKHLACTFSKLSSISFFNIELHAVETYSKAATAGATDKGFSQSIKKTSVWTWNIFRWAFFTIGLSCACQVGWSFNTNCDLNDQPLPAGTLRSTNKSS